VDQVFLLDLALLVDDHRAARRGEFLPHGSQLVLDDGLDARARAQDLEIVGDLFRELVELGLDLVPAERGEALQPQVENGLGLLGGEPRGAAAVTLWRGSSISSMSDAASVAGQSRAINASRASLASFEARISLITSSILATAMASPTRTWARSRALPSRYLVRREITSSRKAMKDVSMSLRFITSGRPPSSATTLAPKLDCSGV
jgi:hypothetical protein